MTELFIGNTALPGDGSFTSEGLQTIKAEGFGLIMNQAGHIRVLPAAGECFGADVMGGILAIQLTRRKQPVLYIDVGASVELVLGNRDFVFGYVCPLIDSVTGVGIWHDGMRTAEGAVNHVEFSRDYEVAVSTIGRKPPKGICWSGIIEIMAWLHKMDIIDPTGNFNTGLELPRLRQTREGWEYVLVWGRNTENGRDITVRQKDLLNFQQAKREIYLGMRALYRRAGLEAKETGEILIAGDFGENFNIQAAVDIGLLPRMDLNRYKYVGNPAFRGAYMCLTSKRACQELHFITGRIRKNILRGGY